MDTAYIDSVVLARLDAESDVLEDDIDLLFDDFDIRIVLEIQ